MSNTKIHTTFASRLGAARVWFVATDVAYNLLAEQSLFERRPLFSRPARPIHKTSASQSSEARSDAHPEEQSTSQCTPQFYELVWSRLLQHAPASLDNIRMMARQLPRPQSLLLVDISLPTSHLCSACQVGADICIEKLDYLLQQRDCDICVVGIHKKTLPLLGDLIDRLDEVCVPMSDPRLMQALQALPKLDAAMHAHCDFAQQFAYYAHCHPLVAQVRYPGLASDPCMRTAASIFHGGFGPVCDVRLRQRTSTSVTNTNSVSDDDACESDPPQIAEALVAAWQEQYGVVETPKTAAIADNPFAEHMELLYDKNGNAWVRVSSCGNQTVEHFEAILSSLQ